MSHPSVHTGARDARAYEAMAHTPNDPAVRKSYQLLRTAIMGQWNGLLAAGFEFEASMVDPYDCSERALLDIERGTLRVFVDAGATLPGDHPMRKLTVIFAGRAAQERGFHTINDVFRGVHDVMGHYAAHKAGEVASFGPIGEFNAWQAHRKTLPFGAHLALWCETRGQNAWTNFYGEHAELPIAERPYAVQKCGIPDGVAL